MDNRGMHWGGGPGSSDYHGHGQGEVLDQEACNWWSLSSGSLDAKREAELGGEPPFVHLIRRVLPQSIDPIKPYTNPPV